MPIVHPNEMYQMIPKQGLVEQVKYNAGNSYNTVYKGGAFYTPKRLEYTGDGIADIAGSIASFIANNSDTIKNIASTAGAVVKATGDMANTTIDVVRKARELHKQKLSDEAIQELLRDKVVPLQQKTETTSGSGFYFLEDAR